MYHIFGDIHGHADKLEQLLIKLSYKKENGYYCHPTHRAIFVGDFIDRGLKIKETLEIVRPMIDSGTAYAVMGNHEYNAICYHSVNKENNKPYRENSDNNKKQHKDTINQLGEELPDYIEWFKTLPLFLEFDSFRVVHACWLDEHITYLKDKFGGNLLKLEYLDEATNPKTKLYSAIEDTLKGTEVTLPNGLSFLDVEGHVRTKVRTRWFLKPDKQSTYYDVTFPPQEFSPKTKLEENHINNYKVYTGDKPVFFGHYWVKDKTPSVITPNIICLDYSVAKGGFIGCYEYLGDNISNQNFVT